MRVKDVSRSVKMQLFINEEVERALRLYMKEAFGPNARNISAVFQQAIMEHLKIRGYWPVEGKDVEG